MKSDLTKQEIDWVFEQIKMELDSHRNCKIRGLTFEGTFDDNLCQGDRKIMKSIFNKLNYEKSKTICTKNCFS